MRQGTRDTVVGLGQSLGSGLIGLVENLGHAHAQKMHNKQRAEDVSKGLGIPYDTAYAILQQPESIQRDLFGRLEGLSVPGQQQQQDENGIAFQPQPQFGTKFGGSAQQNIQQQKLDQARELADEKKNEPFLKGQAEDFNSAKRLYSKAKSMLDNLEKNKAKWPSQLRGTITPDKLYRDADIRKYLADGASLVSALASSRKGQPTNFKIKFEQLSKPDLTMPYETQKKILQGIIKDSQDVFNTQKFIGSETEKNNGRIPGNIRERLVQSGLEGFEDQQQPKSQEFKGKYRKNKAGQVQQWNPETNSYQDTNQ